MLVSDVAAVEGREQEAPPQPPGPAPRPSEVIIIWC